MRQKLPFLCAIFVYLFVNTAFSQERELPGSSFKSEFETKKRLPNIFTGFNNDALLNTEISIFKRRPAGSWGISGILTRKIGTAPASRRKGIQTLLSIATGISQINESQIFVQQGLVSANGQRPTSNSFTVDGLGSNLGAARDGASISGNIGSLPTLTASNGINSQLDPESLNEMTIRTFAAPKEGRANGATVSFSSKAGTNKYHGSVFETFGNEALNANDFFANSRGFGRPASRLNQFGATVGGFLKRDKSFLFANYEGLRLRESAFGVSEVPTLNSRQTAVVSFRPVLNAFALPNGSPTANGLAEFAANYTNPAAHDIFGLRIDNTFTSRINFGGRYSYAASKALVRGDKDFSLNTLRRTDIKTNALSLWTTYTPTSTLVTEGRVNFSRNRLKQQFSVDNFGGADISNLPVSNNLIRYDFTGQNAALVAGPPSQTDINQFQAVGLVEWIRNNHDFSFGADFRRLSFEIGANPIERRLLFSGVSPSLDGTAALINEITRSSSSAARQSNNFSLYAQDVWRLKPNFNINLGGRLDTDFAPDIDQAIPSVQNATLQMPDNFKNFAPRLSLAFDPFNSGRSVIRGGVALYYDFGNSQSSETFANSFPFVTGRFVRNAPFTDSPNNPLTPLTVFDNDLKTPYTWQVYAEYQQEVIRNNVFTINYSAAFGRSLFLTRTLVNINPTFNFIRLTDNSAASDYHALQFRYERRFTNGFTVNSRYTFSKSLDNFSPDLWRENNFVSSDPSAERGVSDFDVRHNLSVYGILDIPTPFDTGWQKHLTRDWTISAFANSRTAFPVNAAYAQITDLGKEFRRPDLISGVPLYLNQETIKRINPNAFSLPSTVRQGTLGRNALRGFPLFQLDASVQRRIKFSNEMSLKLTVQAFNLLNNHNLADMSGQLGTLMPNGNFVPNSYFGRSVSTFGSNNFTPFNLYGGARTIQFSAKFVF